MSSAEHLPFCWDLDLLTKTEREWCINQQWDGKSQEIGVMLLKRILINDIKLYQFYIKMYEIEVSY